MVIIKTFGVEMNLTDLAAPCGGLALKALEVTEGTSHGNANSSTT